MYKLLITDLDDTLYSWIDFFIPAFYEMIEEIVQITGIEKSILINEYQKQHQKVGSVEYPFATLMLPSIQDFYKGLSGETIKEKLNPAFHRFNSVRKCNLKLFEGVAQSLQKINESGICIIGYTESAEENGCYRLEKLGIDSVFEKIYVSESTYNVSENVQRTNKVIAVTGKKPNPEILQKICTQQGVNASETIYLGDSLTKDVYMANQAGITSVQVRCQAYNEDLYQKLVAISHWSAEDFTREQKLKKECELNKITADYVVTDFTDIISIVNTDLTELDKMK